MALISVVIPVLDEEGSLETLYDRLSKVERADGDSLLDKYGGIGYYPEVGFHSEGMRIVDLGSVLAPGDFDGARAAIRLLERFLAFCRTYRFNRPQQLI